MLVRQVSYHEPATAAASLDSVGPHDLGRVSYAKAVHHAYRDADWKVAWDFAGRQSFYGTFDYAK
jgi:hypothetical protein